MKVLLLGVYPPPHGGVQTNVAAIHDYLRRCGHSSSVINLNRYRRPDVDGVYYPSSALGVLRLLSTLDYEILHVHHGGDVTSRLVAMWLICTFTGKKTVLTFHSGGYPSSPEGRATHARTLRAMVCRRFDALIGVNPEILDLFRRMGAREERLRMICPFSVGRLAADMPESLRKFFDAHYPRFITAGGLEPQYDLALQIDALGEIQKSWPGAGLVIAGSGSLDRALREQIASKPYAEHVLLYGDMPHDVTLRAISESTVFLRTTLYDGDAISVREALHLGTPVIATDNGMRPEGVETIPVGDANALNAALARILERGGQKPVVAQRGEENLKAVLDVYAELVAEKV